MKIREIYIVEDNLFYANVLESRLKKISKAKVEIFSKGSDVIARIPKLPYLVLIERELESVDAIVLLKRIKKEQPEVHVLIISGKEQLDLAIDSLIHGATDYLIKGKNDSETGLKEILDYCERISLDNFKKRGGLLALLF